MKTQFVALLIVVPSRLAIQALVPPTTRRPEGFTALFNGKDLTGLEGLAQRPARQPRQAGEGHARRAGPGANRSRREHASSTGRSKTARWCSTARGDSLATAKDYGDFELYVDWKILPKGDSGIYLRGTPQVQIWDPEGEKQNAVGSGGLFNNKKHPSKPTKRADKPIGEWNTFWIKMVGEKVWIKLNDELVVDGVVLENYWERDKPIYPTGQIELQNHGNTLYFKNIYIKELK